MGKPDVEDPSQASAANGQDLEQPPAKRLKVDDGKAQASDGDPPNNISIEVDTSSSSSVPKTTPTPDAKHKFGHTKEAFVVHVTHMWGFLEVDATTDLRFHLNDLNGLRRTVTEGDRVRYKTKADRPEQAFDVMPLPPYPEAEDEVNQLLEEMHKAADKPQTFVLWLMANVTAWRLFLQSIPEIPDGTVLPMAIMRAIIHLAGSPLMHTNGQYKDLMQHFYLTLIRPPSPSVPPFLPRIPAYLKTLDGRDPRSTFKTLQTKELQWTWQIFESIRLHCMDELSDSSKAVLKLTLASFKEVANAHKFKIEKGSEPQRPLMKFPGPEDLVQGPDHPKSGFNPHGPVLQKVKLTGGYADEEEYIKTHFNLLKADCFTNFCRAVACEFHDVESDADRIQNLNSYTHLDLVGQSALPHLNGTCNLATFKVYGDAGEEEIDWSERLDPGSLVCITTNNFKSEVWWATVEVHCPSLLERGLVGLRFLHGKVARLAACIRRNQWMKRSSESIMVETNIFFHGYKAVMGQLDHFLQNNNVPFSEAVVKTLNTTKVPSYRYLRDGYEYMNLLDVMCMETKFDPSQERALRALPTHKVLLVQGPPGTGKSFIGNKLTEAVTRLRVDKRKVSPEPFRPIVVIAYKNRSLDEFLRDCLPFTKKIVRVGGRSKEPVLEQYNIRNLTPLTPTRRTLAFRLADRRTQLQGLAMKLKALRLTVEMAEKYMTAEQKESWGELTQGSLDKWLLGKGTPFVYNVLDKVPDADPIPEIVKEADGESGVRANNFKEMKKEMMDKELSAQTLAAVKLTTIPDNVASMLANCKKLGNLQHLDLTQRMLVAQAWLCDSHKDLMEECRQIRSDYEVLICAAKTAREEQKLEAMRKSDIIGLTTTGCAINQDIIRELQPSVLIVEEAAEILESQLLCCFTPSIHQIIMIGDHKQLQPSVEVHRLGEHCNFSLSLFERLCNNDFSPFMLSTQRRMAPAIASMVSPIYNGLHTHKSVLTRKLTTNSGKAQHCPGLATEIFFWTHKEKEEAWKGSQVNHHEVKMAITLAEYMLKNDIAQSQITIVTPYVGQLRELKAALKSKGLDVEVQTVDSFQGGENDLVILSLVRTKKLTDFLQKQNRMCVALSRARFGLYILGAPDLLRTPNCAHWQRTVNLLESREPSAVGPDLPLACPRHPEQTATANSYEAIPSNFCPRCAKA